MDERVISPDPCIPAYLRLDREQLDRSGQPLLVGHVGQQWRRQVGLHVGGELEVLAFPRTPDGLIVDAAPVPARNLQWRTPPFAETL